MKVPCETLRLHFSPYLFLALSHSLIPCLRFLRDKLILPVMLTFLLSNTLNCSLLECQKFNTFVTNLFVVHFREAFFYCYAYVRNREFRGLSGTYARMSECESETEERA